MLQGPTSVMKQPVPHVLWWHNSGWVLDLWTFGLFDVGILTEFFPVNHLLQPEIVMNCRSRIVNLVPVVGAEK